MDGAAPAIVNAVAHATGVDPTTHSAHARSADGRCSEGRACLTRTIRVACRVNGDGA